jgi:hypothetical protein
MDATAKQLASRFFTQFGAAVAPAQPAAVAAGAKAAGISVSGARASWLTWLLALAVAGLFGYIIGVEHGRRAITINIDPALLERMLLEQKR